RGRSLHHINYVSIERVNFRLAGFDATTRVHFVTGGLEQRHPLRERGRNIFAVDEGRGLRWLRERLFDIRCRCGHVWLSPVSYQSVRSGEREIFILCRAGSAAHSDAAANLKVNYDQTPADPRRESTYCSHRRSAF